jgi:hypothetical protein
MALAVDEWRPENTFTCPECQHVCHTSKCAFVLRDSQDADGIYAVRRFLVCPVCNHHQLFFPARKRDGRWPQGSID